ncbi:MAG: HAMP domain-containing protein [Planctomycetes bacterium]|nr:HAMP domain-containing protein [Planctomycetota bacterium]
MSSGAVVWFCRRLLVEAVRHEITLPSLVPLFLAVLGLVAVATVLVFAQAARSARRLHGPIQRITVAMQRMRTGDIGHRVHLRRGDHLREVAGELNLLLDWLNENPPAGVRTGTDVVEVGPFDPGDRAQAGGESALWAEEDRHPEEFAGTRGALASEVLR